MACANIIDISVVNFWHRVSHFIVIGQIPLSLRDRRYVTAWLHLLEDFVQPFERSVYVDLYPTWGRRHIPSMVGRPPSLHKGHSERQIVHSY